MSASGSSSEAAGASSSAPASDSKPKRSARLVLLKSDGHNTVLPIEKDVSITHFTSGDAWELLDKAWHAIALEIDGQIVECQRQQVRLQIIDEVDPEEEVRLLWSRASRPWALAKNGKKGAFYFNAIQWRMTGHYRVYATLQNDPEFVEPFDDYEPLEVFVTAKDPARAGVEASAMAEVEALLEAMEREAERTGDYQLKPLTKREREWLDKQRGRAGVGSDPTPYMLELLSLDMQRELDTSGRKALAVLRGHFLETDAARSERVRKETEQLQMAMKQGVFISRRFKSVANTGAGAGAGAGASSSSSTAAAPAGGLSAAAKDELRRRLMLQRGLQVTPAPAAYSSSSAAAAGAGAGASSSSAAGSSSSASAGAGVSSSAGPSIAAAGTGHGFVRAPEPSRRVPRKKRMTQDDYPIHLAGSGEPYRKAVEIQKLWAVGAKEQYKFSLANQKLIQALRQRREYQGEDTTDQIQEVINRKYKGKKTWEIVTQATLRLHRHDPIPAGESRLLSSNRNSGVLYRLRLMETSHGWLMHAAVGAGGAYKKRLAWWSSMSEKRRALVAKPDLDNNEHYCEFLAEGFRLVNRDQVPGLQAASRYLETFKPKKQALFDDIDPLEALEQERRRKRRKAAAGATAADEVEAGSGASQGLDGSAASAAATAAVGPSAPVDTSAEYFRMFPSHSLAYRLRRVSALVPSAERTVLLVDEQRKPVEVPAGAVRWSSAWAPPQGAPAPAGKAYGTLVCRLLPNKAEEQCRGANSVRYHAGTMYDLAWRTGLSKRPTRPYTPAAFTEDIIPLLEQVAGAAASAGAGGSSSAGSSSGAGALSTSESLALRYKYLRAPWLEKLMYESAGLTPPDRSADLPWMTWAQTVEVNKAKSLAYAGACASAGASRDSHSGTTVGASSSAFAPASTSSPPLLSRAMSVLSSVGSSMTSVVNATLHVGSAVGTKRKRAAVDQEAVLDRAEEMLAPPWAAHMQPVPASRADLHASIRERNWYPAWPVPGQILGDDASHVQLPAPVAQPAAEEADSAGAGADASAGAGASSSSAGASALPKGRAGRAGAAASAASSASSNSSSATGSGAGAMAAASQQRDAETVCSGPVPHDHFMGGLSSIDPRVPLTDRPRAWGRRIHLQPRVWAKPVLVYPRLGDAELDDATDAFFRQLDPAEEEQRLAMRAAGWKEVPASSSSSSPSAGASSSSAAGAGASSSSSSF